MRLVALTVVAAVELGGVFGSASATVHSIDWRSMTIDLSVEVTVSVQAVVAHLSLQGQEPQVVSLLDRGEGVFGIRTELEPKDYIVVFEAIGPDGGLSAPRSLAELGADLSFGDSSGGASGSDDGARGTRGLGWLALALAAASLSALAFWALAGEDRKEDDGAVSEEE